MINPWILLALVLAWGATVAAAAYKGREAGVASVMAQQALEERVAAVAAAEAASAAAVAVSRLKVQHVATRQILEREVVEKPVFRDCHSGPDSVRAFNAAIPGYAASQPAGSGKLPAPDPAAQ